MRVEEPSKLSPLFGGELRAEDALGLGSQAIDRVRAGLTLSPRDQQPVASHRPASAVAGLFMEHPRHKTEGRLASAVTEALKPIRPVVPGRPELHLAPPHQAVDLLVDAPLTCN